MTNNHRIAHVGNNPPVMSPEPHPVGTVVAGFEWCDACRKWTKQVRKILKSVPGVREASTFLHCLDKEHRGQGGVS